MIEVYALVAVVLLIAGAVVGFVALVSVGIQREERAVRKRKKAPSDLVAQGARAASGFHKRGILLASQEVEW